MGVGKRGGGDSRRSSKKKKKRTGQIPVSMSLKCTWGYSVTPVFTRHSAHESVMLAAFTFRELSVKRTEKNLSCLEAGEGPLW